MPGEEHANGSGQSRLDRLEGLVEVLINGHIEFAEEHKRLLTAQVVLTDRIDRIAAALASESKERKDAHREMDERLNAMIQIVDGMIRKSPPQ